MSRCSFLQPCLWWRRLLTDCLAVARWGWAPSWVGNKLAMERWNCTSRFQLFQQRLWSACSWNHMPWHLQNCYGGNPERKWVRIYRLHNDIIIPFQHLRFKHFDDLKVAFCIYWIYVIACSSIMQWKVICLPFFWSNIHHETQSMFLRKSLERFTW